MSFWPGKRHGFPLAAIFYKEEVFDVDFDKMNKQAKQILTDAKASQFPELTEDNTEVMFLGFDRISLQDGSSPDGYCNIFVKPITTYVQIEEIEDPTFAPNGTLLNANRMIKWNASAGKRIVHEETHRILVSQGKGKVSDSIDLHRSDIEYWAMYEKRPYLIPVSWDEIERIDGKYPVSPLSAFPAVNWNYIAQAVDENW